MLWEFLFHMIDSLSAKRSNQIVLFRCGRFGTQKRKVIHEEVYQSPLSTYAFIQSFLADLGSAEEVKRKHCVDKAASPEQSRWTAPPYGVIKINMDAAVAKNMKKGCCRCGCKKQYWALSGCVSSCISRTKTLEA
jgi:hypothetical protein